ncbi:MAG: DUF4282 domain-containing protein [Syntrophaceae bacterium]|nr:DUF4282 domain-containing protein [Syntrophaceae bacterium]
MFCTNCGTYNKKEAKFCINCGEACNEPRRKEKFLRTVSAIPKQVRFLKALFIFSFHGSVTPKIIKFLYALSILLAALTASVFVMVGLHSPTGIGILAFLGAPLIFLSMVIFSRVLLETMVAIFHMATHATKAMGKSDPKDGIQWNIE